MKNFLKSIARVGFCISSLVVGIFTNLVSSSITGYRTPWIQILDLNGKVTKKYTLPDLGHDILPYIDDFELPNSIVEMQLYMFLGLLLTHPKRMVVFRRSTLIMSIVYMLRSITVLLTSLPDSSRVCYEQFTDPLTGSYKAAKMFPTVFFKALEIFLNLGRDVTCGDMIFSGHTSVLILVCLVFRKYCINRVGRGVVYFITLIGLIAILCSHLHYTIDVIAAIAVTSWTFTKYHNSIHRLGWLESD